MEQFSSVDYSAKAGANILRVDPRHLHVDRSQLQKQIWTGLQGKKREFTAMEKEKEKNAPHIQCKPHRQASRDPNPPELALSELRFWALSPSFQQVS